uniref:RBR-type E3 ubiquitin transferase n=1 Tax=Chromera velia CCMP2878 TaxID=1169474 RepID=A0A0G4G8R5_9ALVE|eukprot:Cvel_4357.t1-p1 / transcript=Cvel_4357.t1 / gene=Cvel_4357 / organism=Chromera_velia_CCMP2878 / gene_product=E3 ubiquitin-protein ligase ARIH1, putative / transcript_product=E3 ubiquitin-protein ligase ARIH1, putative / location=Cvel_scaffold189:14249-16475(-) / protein_length=684 / sequence_SO=supercontig / SO=protein_coding / is_pseudo=false
MCVVIHELKRIEIDRPSIESTLSDVVLTGSRYKLDRHLFLDDLLEWVERFKVLKKSDTFVFRCPTGDAVRREIEEREAREGAPVTAVLVRPPEVFCVGSVGPGRFFIFDSHPRPEQPQATMCVCDPEHFTARLHALTHAVSEGIVGEDVNPHDAFAYTHCEMTFLSLCPEFRDRPVPSANFEDLLTILFQREVAEVKGDLKSAKNEIQVLQSIVETTEQQHACLQRQLASANDRIAELRRNPSRVAVPPESILPNTRGGEGRAGLSKVETRPAARNRLQASSKIPASSDVRHGAVEDALSDRQRIAAAGRAALARSCAQQSSVCGNIATPHADTGRDASSPTVPDPSAPLSSVPSVRLDDADPSLRLAAQLQEEEARRAEETQAGIEAVIATRAEEEADLESRRLAERMSREWEERRRQQEEDAIAAQSFEAAHFFCPICRDTLYEDFRIDTECGASHVLCLECLQQHVRTEIEHQRIPVRCPSCLCDAAAAPRSSSDSSSASSVLPISETALRMVLTPEVHQFYMRRLREISVVGVEGMRQCKAADCSGCAIADDPSVTRFVCPLDPSHRYCMKCDTENGEVHEGHTCDQYQQWRKENEGADRAFEQARGTLYKSCPNRRCRTPIEKTYGCNHMQCTVSTCKTHFCWVCEQACENQADHAAHFQPRGRCPWYSQDELARMGAA